MSFKIRTRKLNGLPVLALAGELAGVGVSEIAERLERLRKATSQAIVVDLSKATFIDSHGLGVFVFFFRRFAEERRELVFIRPSEFVRDLFNGSNLNKVFTIVDSEEGL